MMLMLIVGILSTIVVTSTSEFPQRELVSTRNLPHRRVLPGSKGSSSGSSSSSSSSTTNTNCVGKFGSWGSCSIGSGKQSRTYTITQAKQGSGTACAKSAGASEFRACGDCVGAWSCWTACDATTLQKSRTFIVTTPATGSGTACTTADQEVEQSACTPATKSIDWTYYSTPADWKKESLNDLNPALVSTELKVVHCDIGETVEISWGSASASSTTSATMKHDLWSMGNEQAYVSCDVTSATQLVPPDAKCGYQIQCSSVGTTYYACNVDGACANGLQRVRIIVTDSSKTATIKSQKPGLKTLADVMEDDLVPVAYAKAGTSNVLTDTKADEIQVKLEAIVTSSPTACADWLLPVDLNDATCKAFAYTDMGYLARKRPTPDYTQAETHYDRALNLIANFCPALAYKTELHVNKGEKSLADAAFRLACQHCGTNSLDMSDVRLAYGRKQWNVPEGTECTAEVPKRFNSEQLQKFQDDNAKDLERQKKLTPTSQNSAQDTTPSLGDDTPASLSSSHTVSLSLLYFAFAVMLTFL